MFSLPDLQDDVTVKQKSNTATKKKINDSRLKDFVVSPIHITLYVLE